MLILFIILEMSIMSCHVSLAHNLLNSCVFRVVLSLVVNVLYCSYKFKIKSLGAIRPIGEGKSHSHVVLNIVLCRLMFKSLTL